MRGRRVGRTGGVPVRYSEDSDREPDEAEGPTPSARKTAALEQTGRPCYPPLVSESPRLPHAYPFRFIAREDGEIGLSFASGANDAVSRGAAVPPWVILEVMTQAAGLLAASGEGKGGALVQVSCYRCPRRIWPGDTLRFRGECLKRMGPVLRVRMSAFRESRLVARGVLTLREGGG
jgi:hypothetical protein